ncbi:MAG: hypothetical protein IT457_06255 [Planctomycetes bacterium]|nr:hypothetical protein [Planctomycetota bacterium]
MRIAAIVTLFTALACFSACTSEAGASITPTNVAGEITKLLTGITDGKTAEAAKGQLETLTGSLGKALEGLKSAGEAAKGSGEGLAGAAGDLAKKALDSFTPELKTAFNGITEQITRLLGIADVKTAIGPMLEKLKALLPV